MTTFRIGDIRPNPFRNIDRYPINREKVAKLKESIGRTEFWDNLVARIAADGKPEIAYGHHRMVALREMYPPEHDIDLIVRDLDDAAMLHVMADENMQEWASSGEIIVETVRAVRDFLGAGAGKVSTGGRPPKSNGAEEVVSFLGWPRGRVEDALAIIYAEEAGVLEPEDTAGLGIEQATVLRQHVSRIREPEVRKHAIASVRGSLERGEIGKRGIGEVVRQVREQAAPPPPKPVVAAKVAEGLYRDIDNFWRVAIDLNGHGRLTRAETIRLIAANRDAMQLDGLALPWSEQIALALDEMARTAEKFAAVLRAEDAIEALP